MQPNHSYYKVERWIHQRMYEIQNKCENCRENICTETPVSECVDCAQILTARWSLRRQVLDEESDSPEGTDDLDEDVSNSN